jgi:FMN-dependent NADH-azoreductase
MTNILYVTSSPRGKASHSAAVGARVLDELKAAYPGAKVTVRDLAREPLPHIDEDFVVATRGPNGPQSEVQKKLVARSDALVDELLAADVVVLAVAMINFTIPSTLKSWLDYVARPGRTFSYSEKGPEGLVKGKRVIVVQAKGGIYSGNGKGADFLDPYLRHMLAFLGMTDVQAIAVEGTGLGEESTNKALAHGRECAHAVVGELAHA